MKTVGLWFFPEYNFREPSVLFRPEMLEWPFFSPFKQDYITDEVFITIYRRAIKGLAKLSPPFTSWISIEADEKNKKFVLDKRTWGQIFLGDDCILSLCRDRRYDDWVFKDLIEWPQLHTKEYQNWEEIKLNLFYSYSSDLWTSFFREVIEKDAKILEKEAEQKVSEALELQQRAMEIFSALNLNKQFGI